MLLIVIQSVGSDSYVFKELSYACNVYWSKYEVSIKSRLVFCVFLSDIRKVTQT